MLSWTEELERQVAQADPKTLRLGAVVVFSLAVAGVGLGLWWRVAR